MAKPIDPDILKFLLKDKYVEYYLGDDGNPLVVLDYERFETKELDLSYGFLEPYIKDDPKQRGKKHQSQEREVYEIDKEFMALLVTKGRGLMYPNNKCVPDYQWQEITPEIEKAVDSQTLGNPRSPVHLTFKRSQIDPNIGQPVLVAEFDKSMPRGVYNEAVMRALVNDMISRGIKVDTSAPDDVLNKLVTTSFTLTSNGKEIVGTDKQNFLTGLICGVGDKTASPMPSDTQISIRGSLPMMQAIVKELNETAPQLEIPGQKEILDIKPPVQEESKSSHVSRTARAHRL
ncbi:MAG: hypothetical protein H6908_06090 [Hyphomicrobiales bacterium]|nr:hypothetical protein [Rickettsiales bacterium]MCP5362182.1 hypothetical protein [Hyphomicrobiales bacterium]